MDLRQIVIGEMESQGISGYRMAQLTGLNATTINRYGNGERDMTGERLGMLLDVLGLEVRGQEEVEEPTLNG